MLPPSVEILNLDRDNSALAVELSLMCHLYPSVTISNKDGGKQVHPKRLNSFPILQNLINDITEHLYDKWPLIKGTIYPWVNINVPMSYNDLHTHGSSAITCGVYYVDVPPLSGNIVFHHDGKQYSYTPLEGDLILFPPTLPHEVERNLSDQSRISVAFNYNETRTSR